MSIKQSYLASAWYTTRFLAEIDKHRQSKSPLSVGEIEDSFLKQIDAEGQKGMQEFPIINQAYLTMFAYAVLVSPREIIDNHEICKQFPFTTKDKFTFIKPASYNTRTNNILKKMRNSISHAYMDSDENLGIFTFTDKYEGKINFQVKITRDGFLDFLTEVTKYYATKFDG